MKTFYRIFLTLFTLKEIALNKAVALLEDAVSEHGILASTIEADNYKRVWARDGIVAGVAGLLINNKNIIEGLKRTIVTLSNYQHALGMVPSNVLVKKNGADYSLGSIAGRVDATCWYIIGACLLLKKHPDFEKKDWLKKHIDKALLVLDYWEFNAKGLLYIPTSGNWADEYPVKGHTLYDNLLRLWGLRLYQSIFGNKKTKEKLELIEEKIRINFWPEQKNSNSKLIYHPRLFKGAAEKKLRHWLCYLAPEGFNTTFDAAGNGLALLLNIGNQEQTETICNYLNSVYSYLGKNLIPAFWPPIHPGAEDWASIANNYSFDFKNHPYHFHNGGIWPVWMGLLSLGLSVNGKKGFSENILVDYLKIETPEKINFYEYISSDKMQPGGKKPLCYSASGLVFMTAAIQGGDLKLLGIEN
ncbi:MAG: glycoside hydrolase 100 family protein [Bacteroidota bacterium]